MLNEMAGGRKVWNGVNHLTTSKPFKASKYLKPIDVFMLKEILLKTRGGQCSNCIAVETSLFKRSMAKYCNSVSSCIFVNILFQRDFTIC